MLKLVAAAGIALAALGTMATSLCADSPAAPDPSPTSVRAPAAASATPASPAAVKATPSNPAMMRQGTNLAAPGAGRVDNSSQGPQPSLCVAPPGLVKLGQALRRVALRLAAHNPIKIVAIGSSSTAGAMASSPAAAYPSRLADYLKQRFPDATITVINRGVNGEEAADMLNRLDADVTAENPDLVLWQVGTNAVLRNHPLTLTARLIHEGIARLKASGADVVLIDPQYSPRVIAKSDAEPMVDLIATASKRENVGLFRRFAVMRHWRDQLRMGFDSFVSADGLHMNDWSYGCWAKLLASGIADALNPVTAVAGAKLQSHH